MLGFGQSRLTGDFFAEVAVSAYMVAEVASTQVVHDQVQVLAVLERVVHVDDEDVVQLNQNLPLVDYAAHASLGHDPRLAHLFHSVHLLPFLTEHAPDFAEATLSDTVIVYEFFL